MKNIFFWSPHIDPQVATVKSVTNSLKSLIKYKKNLNLNLLNVFGEWDEFVMKGVNIINLKSNKKLKNHKFKGFINSRTLYLKILFNSYFPLKKILNEKRPDYLLIHLVTIVPILLFIFNNFQTKLILRISGLPKLHILRYILWKIVSKKVAYIICPTEETRSDLIKKDIFESNKIVCIQDPIINIKNINVLKREQLEEEYEKPYLLCVGRFTKQKNHQFLLNFFFKNPDYFKDMQLIIVGNGEFEEKYKKFIKKNKLEKDIKILKYKKNIFNYIYKAKSIISCSLWEDPGFIMVEAASVNTPIITSNCPSGPKEFVGNNENGFIFDSNNEKSFKIALDNFLNTSEKDLNIKLTSAKKKAKMYTGLYNAKRLVNIIKY